MNENEIRLLARLLPGTPAQDASLDGLGVLAHELAEAMVTADGTGASRREAFERALAGHPEIDAPGLKFAMFRSNPNDATQSDRAPALDGARRFRLITIEELMTMPPLRWLVENHLPAGGLAVLYGAPGGGKSFVALDLALSIGSGHPWLGIERVISGPVVYIAAEGTAGLSKRLVAWREAHEGSVVDQVFFLTAPVAFMERGDVEELLIELGALSQTPAMVVIDTLARSLVGGEENSAKDVGLFISGADRIRTEFDAAVLIIHHTGKNGDTERGSSALRAAADVMMRLSADDGVLTLACDKMKDALPFDTCYLRLKVTEDGESCTVVMTSGSPVVAGRLTKNHRLVLDAVAGFPEGEASYTRICEASTVAPGSFGRLLKGLVAESYVEKSRQKYAVTARGRSYLTPDSIAITALSANTLDS